MKKLTNICLMISIAGLSVGCDLVNRIKYKAEVVNNYEKAALKLAQENRELKVQVSKLKFEIQSLKAEKNYLGIKLKRRKKRTIASYRPAIQKGDLVKYKIYKWSAVQLLKIGETAFEENEYEKAAQYLNALITEFPGNRAINDEVLFKAGVASYESGKHFDWAIQYLSKVTLDHPTSKYFRGAKLWLALSNFKTNEKKKFFDTVEEFRIKYRNTKEWKILSAYYEDFIKKYKN